MNRGLILLFALSFDLAAPKVYEICDFVEEISEKHNVTRDEVFKHVCIISDSEAIRDTQHSSGIAGIYGIKKRKWCGKESEASGGCKIECSKLIDDDISDDIVCVNKILATEGLEEGWDLKEEDCDLHHRETLRRCYRTIEDSKVKTISENFE